MAMSNRSEEEMTPVYLVSACLLGLCTRYDSGHNLRDRVLQFCAGHRCIPVCPEQLGGLSTPRPEAEIFGGDGHKVLDHECIVSDKTGNNVTSAFKLGAQLTLQMARLFNAQGAVLKSLSPSCGSGLIYDGTFRNRCVDGDGVTAALLKRCGIAVYDEFDLPDA